jgi:hypothetical protein
MVKMYYNCMQGVISRGILESPFNFHVLRFIENCNGKVNQRYSNTD